MNELKKYIFKNTRIPCKNLNVKWEEKINKKKQINLLNL